MPIDCIIKTHEMLVFVKKIGFLLRIVQNYIDQFVSVSKDLEQMVYNICSFIMPKNSN